MLFVQISFFFELFFCEVSKLSHFSFSTSFHPRALKSAQSGASFRKKQRKSLVETYSFSASLTYFSLGKRFLFVKSDEFYALFPSINPLPAFTSVLPATGF